MLHVHVAVLDWLCFMWEECQSVWWAVLILTVEPFRGWVTVRAIREWAHLGFVLIIQEKLIKVKGKTLTCSPMAAASDMKNVLYHGFSSSLLFLRLTFLSPYVMLAVGLWWFMNFSVWCVCVCVLFYVVAYYFYSRLVYSFSAYRKCYDPMNQNVCLPVWLLLSWKTNPAPWNMPSDDLWTLVGFSLGSVVSGQGSQHIMVWFIIPPTQYFSWNFTQLYACNYAFSIEIIKAFFISKEDKQP